MTKPPTENMSRTPNMHLEDETLSAYFDAELRPDEMSGATGHLESCASCREKLALLRRSARAVGEPVVPVSRTEREAQLERAIGASSIRELPDTARRASRRLMVTRWAAALLVVAGGGVAFWRFGPASGGSGPSASSAGTTPLEGNRSAAPAHGPAAGEGSTGRSAPIFQLRLLEGPQSPGCGQLRAARAASLGPTTLYDASAAETSGTPMCARVGGVLTRLVGATNARIVKTRGGRSASLILTLPLSSAHGAHSVLVRHPGDTIAIVAGNEVIGYLGTVQPSTRSLTVVRVPAALAREISTQIGIG